MLKTQISDLPVIFSNLAARWGADNIIIQRAWLEIANRYSDPARHYHTLTHLADIIDQLAPFEGVEGWDVLLFATFYHDIIYDVSAGDNEDKSAAFAAKEFIILDVPEDIIEKCKALILATKTHSGSGDELTDLFIDADMSILGREWDVYIIYAQNVRKEYSIYPDALYNPGRKKVLTHFLEMGRIFKTDHFHRKYEHQARENLIREIKDAG